jgi:hypothetical protein
MSWWYKHRVASTGVSFLHHQIPLSNRLSKRLREAQAMIAFHSLYALEADPNCKLRIELTLNPGDVLFALAPFPHTTSTIIDDDDSPDPEETSIHLTMNED